MCYHHIVIATDLSDDGKRLVEKGRCWRKR